MAKAIGIDLGTTNTVAAEAQQGRREPATIQTRNYGPLTRSVVAYQSGGWLVGADAEEVGKFTPDCVIASSKRFIGINFGDSRIQGDTQRLNHIPSRPRVVAPPSGESGVRFRFYPNAGAVRDLSPIEVATLILTQVKQDADQATGSVVTHAVITAPAYFEAARIEATRQAGEAAGLQVLRIVSEPLAAALAYGIRQDASAVETVLVFDMGGGTLDVTVCAIGQDQCIELAKDGDNHLGGDDFDRRLEQLILKRLRDASGVDFLAPDSGGTEVIQTLRYELRRACRGAKEKLSTADEVPISDSVWGRHRKAHTPGAESVKISRADFETAIADLVDQAMRLTQQALEKAHCKPTDISRVLLVGGSTYVPVIRERLRAIFGSEKVRIDVNPMEAVAQGAALLAATLPNLVLCPECRTDQPADATVCNQCGATLKPSQLSKGSNLGGRPIEIISTIARSIKVKTEEGNLIPLFTNGAQYSPTAGTSLSKARETFRFAATGARSLRVEFYEGEGRQIEDPQSSFYAEFTVPGLPTDTRQGEEVILEATLNGDGSIAGIVTFRGKVYSYIASPSRWRGVLVDTIEKANLMLPNVPDSAARRQLEQVRDHAEEVVIERSAGAAAGRNALKALETAIDEIMEIAPSEAPEMQKLLTSLGIAGAMLEYGTEWVNLMPMVTAPPLRDALQSESQLLIALRPAVAEGRQIEARNETAFAERAADRIDSLMHASTFLVHLTFAQLISEYAEDGSRKRGPGGILAQREWERLRGGADQRVAAAPAGTPQQDARDIGALLEQMRVTIVTAPALFHTQFQRVMQLMDQFYAAEA